ncbi:MAG: J domain-containing protein [Spirochaetales bacterium]|nr:J domain-containing protein [Spirochaetales bacterium]
MKGTKTAFLKILRRYTFSIILGIGGFVLTGWFGVLTGIIGGALIDQLIKRLKNKKTENPKQEDIIKKTEQQHLRNYRILGVSPETPERHIKKVYHNLASNFHPDNNKGLSEKQKKLSEEAFKLIAEAYDDIKD